MKARYRPADDAVDSPASASGWEHAGRRAPASGRAGPRPGWLRFVVAGLVLSVAATGTALLLRSSAGDTALAAVGAEAGRSGASVGTVLRRPEHLWDAPDERAAGLAYRDGAVYHVSSRDTRLFVYDAGSGAREGVVNLGQAVFAFASSGRHLHALLEDTMTVATVDAAAGEETWRRRWPADGRLWLSAGDGRVLVASKHALRVLDAGEGTELWTWRSDAGALIGPVEVAGGTVYVPHVDRVSALEVATGERRWSLDIVTQDIDAGASIATFVTTDGLVGVDVTSGERLWQVPGTVHGSGAITSGAVFAFVGDALVRIDPRNGEVRWRQVLVAPREDVRVGGPYANDEAVYVTVGPRLLAFGASDGEPEWALEDPAGNAIRLALVVDRGVFFAGGESIRAYGTPIR